MSCLWLGIDPDMRKAGSTCAYTFPVRESV